MTDLNVPPTEMAHYECSECTMEATGVATPALAVAWLDHMQSHGPLGQYNSWAWTIVPLRFQMDEPEPSDTSMGSSEQNVAPQRFPSDGLAAVEE